MIPKIKSKGVVLQNFPGYFLIACLLLSVFLLFSILWPFVTVLILSAIFATTFYPFYNFILRFLGKRRGAAAFITCFLVLILIIIPLILFVLLLAKEALETYTLVKFKISSGEFDQFIRWQPGNFFYDLYQANYTQLNSFFDFNTLDLKASLTDLAGSVSTYLLGQSAAILKGILALIFSFLVLMFAMYYMLKDNKNIMKKIMHVCPLPVEHQLELFKKFKEMSRATLYGIFLVSVIKGFLGGVAFAIAGIPNPLFWGTAMALFSLIPLFGATLIWLPAAILLLVNGHTAAGVFLLVWGVLVISTIDNIFQAFFIGKQANLNPLLVFMAVFGGIGLFNLLGVIFGPLILTIFFTLLHIYELEYKKILPK